MRPAAEEVLNCEDGINRSDLEAKDSRATPTFETLPPIIPFSEPLQEVISNPYGDRPACFKNTFEECVFVLTTTLAIGQSSIFNGATTGILFSIASDLNMNAAEVTWISASQALSAGCFLLFFGKVADLFGRRMMFLISMASFAACLLITGFAINAIYMDVLCGLLGLCSATAVPPAIGILGAVYQKPSRRKNRAFACFSAGNPLGFVTGLLVSGIATAAANWRASFWVLTVIYGAFSVAAWRTVPRDDGQTKMKLNRETLSRFDFLGTFLVVSGIAMFTSALTWVFTSVAILTVLYTDLSQLGWRCASRMEDQVCHCVVGPRHNLPCRLRILAKHFQISPHAPQCLAGQELLLGTCQLLSRTIATAIAHKRFTSSSPLCASAFMASQTIPSGSPFSGNASSMSALSSSLYASSRKPFAALL